MILTKDKFKTEDIIKMVSGNMNLTVKKSVLEEWLKSSEEELIIGKR